MTQAERAASFATEHHAARAELAAGLARPQAMISPKYFYDALGSKLFEAICQLDEYYLTRAEAAIFAAYAAEIAQAAGPGCTIIDLGAGNCEKAAGLFPALRPKSYIPIDISVSFLNGAVENLRQKHPEISMHPLGLDFSESLNLPEFVRRRPNKMFFYPGSSLGNFTPLGAAQLLRRLREHDAALLIGIDITQDPQILHAAYDDALGVTAAFNLNVLRHVNRLLGSDFNIKDWSHLALFNAAQSRVEMHLQARHDLTLRWPGGARRFAAGERIHTENSYKYSPATLLELLREAGFGAFTCWRDPAQQFMVCHARPV